MRSTTAALWSGVTSSDSILPTLTPGDLHVLARDDREGVHEDRAHAVGAAVVARARAEDQRARAAATQDAGDGEDALHGPGSTRLGSQSRVPSCRGRAPSRRPAAGEAAPGQRRDLAGLQAGEALAGRDRRERAAGRVVGEREGVEDRLDAREVAVGVVVRRALAEVAQPADEVGRVGPDELDHRRGLLQRRDRVREATAWRRCSSAGALPSRSVRSLSGPLRCTSVLRSAIVGRASCTSGRSWRRKRARSLVAGLDAADQHVEVVERRAQVDERRVGLAQRAGQQRRAPGRATRSRRRSPPPSCWRWRRGWRGRRGARPARVVVLARVDAGSR